MRHIKLSKFTEGQVLEEIYSSKTFYDSYSIGQGYTKNNLKDHIDKALHYDYIATNSPTI